MSANLGPDIRLEGRTPTYNRDEVVQLIIDFYQSVIHLSGIDRVVFQLLKWLTCE
jgi:hypothetical protein